MTRSTHPVPRFRARSATTSYRPPAAARRRRRAVPPHEGSVPRERVGELSLEVRRAGERPVIVVSGELDMVGRELLEAVLAHVRSTHAGAVAVDLSGVSYANSHGLAPALDGDVVLVAASPWVSRLLRLMGHPVHGGGSSGEVDGPPARARGAGT
ncbi:STAS domain-containing protein [Blastococcus sp. KM273128]|uniref:STAS domain-containing protein n=1 Tax=Blastococcus sp. KM273128 TaxID=2570314 RepID=UPI001F263242|nr:STAS domain-containing protein [Blastococcus sp. KM273128]MCF6745481.1 STAS domain-containing protein [Blastococcus sp. KM273128]